MNMSLSSRNSLTDGGGSAIARATRPRTFGGERLPLGSPVEHESSCVLGGGVSRRGLRAPHGLTSLTLRLRCLQSQVGHDVHNPVAA